MAISYTHKGVNFSINTTGLNALSGLYGRQTISQWDRISSGSKTTIEPFINAVEIDWNSAKLGQTTINTTGESRCSMLVQGIAA